MAKDKVEILFQIQKDTRALKAMQDNFNDLQKDVVKLDKGINKAFNLAGNVAKFIGVLAVARKAWQVTTSLINRGIDFTATKEQSQVAFETLLGSADEAKERIDDLIEFAAKTPFRLPGIIDANRQLQVLTDGTLAGKEGLRLVGDAAAATGRDMSQVAFWIGRTYAGLQSGTPVGEATLRLIEMGLVSGSTALELQRLAKTARSSSQAMEIIEETFAGTSGAMERQSRTLVGLKTTLSDTIDKMAGDLSKPIFDVFKNSIEGLLIAMGALDSQTEVATAKISDLVTEALVKAGDAVGVDEAINMIDDATLKLREQLKELNEDIDTVPRRVVENGQPGETEIGRFGVNAKGSAFETLDAYKSALTVAENLRSQLRSLAIAYDTILNGTSNTLAIQTRDELMAEIKSISAQIETKRTQIKNIPITFFKTSLINQKAIERIKDKQIASLEKKLITLTTRFAAASFQLGEKEFAENAQKRKELEILDAKEAKLNEANTITKKLIDSGDKLNKEHESAVKAFELQNATLAKQKEILEGRLKASKEASKAERDLLEIPLQAAKKNVVDNASRDSALKIQSKEELAALQNIETSKKKFLTEQIKLETDLLKLDEKIAEKRETDIKDNFKVLVAEANLKLDNIRHGKDLLELDGLAIAERETMNRLVEREKELIQEVINLRTKEVAAVENDSNDKVRIAALQKEIQELKQKKETVKGGPTELEIQKEVNASNVEAINLTIGKIQHQKELLELNELEVHEREGMLNLIAQESKAIEAIIALRKLELSLVSESTGDQGEIDRLNTIIAQLEQRLQLNEASKQDVIPKTRLEQIQDDFNRRNDPENTFETTKEAAVAALLDFQTQAGTFTSQFYDELLTIQNTLTGSMSESIEGLITRTMSWGDAMRNVGNAIGTTLVKSIADMAAQWVTSQLTMFVMGKTLAKSSTKLAKATNAELAASAAPAATLTAIASYGGSVAAAALIAPAMLANAAVGSALASAPIVAAETGGLIRGGEQFVRMNEKGEEFVINADVTKSFGMDFWNGVNQGRITPQNIRQTAPFSESSGGSASASNVNVAVFSKIEDASSWLDSQEGEKKFIDTYQRLKDQIAVN